MSFRCEQHAQLMDSRGIDGSARDRRLGPPGAPRQFSIARHWPTMARHPLSGPGTSVMPVRRMPHVGDHVTVAFFAATVDGVIAQIERDHRRVHVITADGETITFALSRATGQFVADAGSSGARLVFQDRSRGCGPPGSK